MQRHQRDIRAEANRRGARGQRRAEGQRCATVTVSDKMMLGHPNFVVTELLDFRREIELGSIMFAVIQPRLVELTAFEKNSESHCLSPLKSCSWRAKAIIFAPVPLFCLARVASKAKSANVDSRLEVAW